MRSPSNEDLLKFGIIAYIALCGVVWAAVLVQ